MFPALGDALDSMGLGSEAPGMEDGNLDLPDWAPLALAHARGEWREALETLLSFDQRLGRIVYGASEPVLGQLRLAWWREEIGRERTAGTTMPPDPLLAAIITHWGENRSGLLALIDGWENLLGEPPWAAECHAAFCEGRALALAALADLTGEGEQRAAISAHGHAWGLAEILVGDPASALPLQPLPRLPRSLRSIAIIGGLAKRAAERGGQPLLGDRASPLVALRLGILGF